MEVISGDLHLCSVDAHKGPHQVTLHYWRALLIGYRKVMVREPVAAIMGWNWLTRLGFSTVLAVREAHVMDMEQTVYGSSNWASDIRYEIHRHPKCNLKVMGVNKLPWKSTLSSFVYWMVLHPIMNTNTKVPMKRRWAVCVSSCWSPMQKVATIRNLDTNVPLQIVLIGIGNLSVVH